jgi:hypothetical protein
MVNKATRKMVGIVSVLVVIIVVIVLVLVVRHKDKNSVSSLTPAQISSAKAEIGSNWQTFFGPTASLQNRENLLQNGSQFAQIIGSEFAALGQESFSSTINNISLTSTTAANVVYTGTLGGQVVLKNEAGSAVKVGGVWKVSDATLCQLLALDGSKPAVCKTT